MPAIEELLLNVTTSIDKLTAVTEKLMSLRVEGMAKVEAVTAPKAGKAAPKAVELPAEDRQISTSPEDRQPEPEASAPPASDTTGAPTLQSIQTLISGYLAVTDKVEHAARKSLIVEILDKVGAKLTPPRPAGQTKTGDVPVAKYPAFTNAVNGLIEDVAKNGELTKRGGAAVDDDEL